MIDLIILTYTVQRQPLRKNCPRFTNFYKDYTKILTEYISIKMKSLENSFQVFCAKDVINIVQTPNK